MIYVHIQIEAVKEAMQKRMSLKYHLNYGTYVHFDALITYLFHRNFAIRTFRTHFNTIHTFRIRFFSKVHSERANKYMECMKKVSGTQNYNIFLYTHRHVIIN